MISNNKNQNDLMMKIVSLAKRRGFVYPGSEIYGGLANSWDYGPLGVELKNNIKQLWWKKFIQERDDMVGLESAIIMSPKVWEASGHTGTGFSDSLVECQRCHERFRCDDLDSPEATKEMSEHIFKKHHETVGSVTGFKYFTKPRQFNILMKTFLGSVEGEKSVAYLRGETAQGMFVNFKNILDTTRLNLPFGIAQIGKAFRNEITPGNFIFRLREFEMMEIEYFVRPPKEGEARSKLSGEKEWEKYFEYWRKQMIDWIKELGVNVKKIHEIEIPEAERAHYSKRTIDFEYEFPFGQKELYGLAYRTDFDLKNHEKSSGQNLKYKDPETGEEFWPHVIEPTWGVDRSVLVTLLEAYCEEKDRIILKLPLKLAPYKVAVFPLLANKPKLVKKAREIYEMLKPSITVAWDDRGNIGKRYYSQDEIGTPFCITIDFASLENDDVTVRDRDTMKQERVKIKELDKYFNERLN